MSMDGSQCLNCVRSEIHNVLSTMRRNGRWASEERFIREIPSDFENPLIRSLKSLHDYLQPFEDINDVDAVAYLQPFLDVVAFPNTNGAMTGRALSSINKFLLYGSVTQESPRGREAINLAVASVVECKFEATNSYNDEVVLMQLLEVMVNLLRCPAGSFISDVNVWKMVETCHRLSSEKGTSHLLRRTAANSLTHLILTLFSRAAELITPEALADYGHRPVDFEGPPDGYHESVVSWHRARRQSGEGEMLSDDDEDSIENSDDEMESEGSSVKGDLNRQAIGTPSSGARPLSVATTGAKMGEASSFLSPSRNNSTPEIKRNPSSTSLSTGSHEDDPDEALYRMLQPIRFGNANSAVNTLQHRPHSTADSYGLPVLVRVLDFLSELTDPSQYPEATCVFALQLINIVLESGGESLGTCAHGVETSQETSPIISALQGDLCKHLLQNSQSQDLSVLSLTLRVIFNLFSAMKGHLKVQLEVFLTSVHLRIAESPSATFEQKELALESLLDFCREPALMLDLYTNYDCDFRCTNLFETLCKCLCRCSIPKAVLSHDTGIAQALAGTDFYDDDENLYSSISSEEFSSSLDHIMSISQEQLESGGGGVTVLEALALEGVLAVIDAIARRCDKSRASTADSGLPSRSKSPAPVIARVEELRQQHSDVDSGMESDSSSSMNLIDSAPDEDLTWLANARERKANLLRERKRMKRRLLLAARQFNKQHTKQYWLEYAHDLGILPHSPTPADVAQFFLNTPGLDKACVGDYLSEDPERKPFNNEVMKAYIQSFDFTGVRIDLALRMLLESFRLPGEAQKVDRLMEAFGAHIYVQNKLTDTEQSALEHQAEIRKLGINSTSLNSSDAESIGTGQTAANSHSNPVDSARGVFKSADAAFIFAFSIIMLHTDLHNPGITAEKKMKQHEFIRNNRNINDGENLPETLLVEVYNAIKGEEMRMLYDPHSHSTNLNLDDFTSGDGAPKSLANSGPTWDTVLRHSQMVDKASFTPKSLGRLGYFRAGVHERDMYSIIFDSSMQAISVMFEMTRDGKMAGRALEGFRNLGKIAVYFEMTDYFNRIMIAMCRYFIRFFPALGDGAQSEADLEGLEALRDATILSMRHGKGRLKLAASLARAERYAAHPSSRALLTFRALLSLTKQYGDFMRESWRNFVQTLLAMHEFDLLPSSFVEVDDVVDAHGHRLPTTATELSPTGHSRGEVVASTRSTQGKPVPSKSKRSGGGFFSTLTSFIWSEEEELDETYLACKDLVRETLAECRMSDIFSKSKSLSEESLILLLDALLVPLEEPSFASEEEGDHAGSSPSFERNTVICVELLTKVGIVNADRIGKIWPLLRRAYRQVLVNAGAVPEGDDDIRESSSLFIGHDEESSEVRIGQGVPDDHEANKTTPKRKRMKQVLKKRPNRVRRVGSCSVFVVERVVVSLLRIGVHLVDKVEVLPSLLGALNWFADFSDEVCSRLAARIGSGLSTVLRFQGGNLTSAVEWRIVCRLLKRFCHFPDSVDATWDVIQTAVNCGHVNRVNMNSVLEIVNLFIRNDEMAALPPRAPPNSVSQSQQTSKASNGIPPKGTAGAKTSEFRDITARWSAERAADAVSLIFELSKQVFSRDPDFCGTVDKIEAENSSSIEKRESGSSSTYIVKQSSDLLLPDRQSCWVILMVQIRAWFLDPRPEVAMSATQCLQSALWTPDEKVSLLKWSEVFDKVLFPLVDQCTQSGNQQTVYRAVNLLTRTFLHNIQALGSSPEFQVLWLRIIGFMSKRLAGNETVRETTLENLKNLIMVMQGDVNFIASSNAADENIWDLTWSTIESHAPGVRSEIEASLAPVPLPNSDSKQARMADLNRRENGATKQVEVTRIDQHGQDSVEPTRDLPTREIGGKPDESRTESELQVV